jgi:hypothetical protein
MEATSDDFRRHFELLSDGALRETNRNDLVEKAKRCYDQEIVRRGLDTDATKPPRPGTLSDGDRLVQVAKYHSRSEFEAAAALLRSASISCHQGNRIGRRIELELPLMVPAAFAEEALEILRTRISDEDLDALAETTIPGTEFTEDEVKEEESSDEAV